MGHHTTKQLVPLCFNHLGIEEVNIIIMDEIMFLINSGFKNSKKKKNLCYQKVGGGKQMQKIRRERIIPWESGYLAEVSLGWLCILAGNPCKL